MKLEISILPVCLALAACSSDPPLGDEGAIDIYQDTGDVIVERQSRRIICVTEDSVKTCVPVVHDETGEEK